MRLRVFRMLPALILANFLPCLAGVPGAEAAAGLFDNPAKLVQLPLPADPANPDTKAQLTCAYYPHFMVKEIDLGELGAQQLSIVPIATGQGNPACRAENSAEEKVISAKDWSGYFWGVKGGYVFFSADDGWNGGIGFAVFSAEQAGKLFEDAAKTWHSVRLSSDGLMLRYQRVFEAKCSLRAEPAGCWQQIRQDTGLTGAAGPDCTAAYAAEQKRTPAFAEQVLADPTVFDYEVVVTLDAGDARSTPASAKIVNCRPSE
jgi:hypothetical protein